MSLPKVLIVDDREYDRILYKEYLDSSNYEFTETDDGANILGILSQRIPDVILLDWQMPKVGGLEVLKLLKKNNSYKNIPIIIITGLQDEKILEEAFDYGSIDFLNKPVTNVELNSRVQNVLKLYETQKLLLNQKRELLELNQIIKSQKEELQKALIIKNEMLETTEIEFQKGIGEKNRKVMTLELDTTKFINSFKSYKAELKESIDLLKDESEAGHVAKKLKTILRNMEALESHQDSWSEFKDAFENIDSEFFKNLSKVSTKLTTLDFKHCAYIKLNLDNYEVAKILNVELKSLQMTRYRLKKKLKLGENKSLREFIHSI